MTISQILTELRSDRDNLSKAIFHLEKLLTLRGKGSGEAQGSVSDDTATKRRGRPPGSKNRANADANDATAPKQLAARASSTQGE